MDRQGSLPVPTLSGPASGRRRDVRTSIPPAKLAPVNVTPARSAALALLSVFAATGCIRRDWLNEPAIDADPGASAESPTKPVVVQSVDVAYDGPEETTPLRAAASLPASNADHPRPDPVLFRLGAGHGTLAHVDLQPCRDLGLPPGYLRMRVTFHPSGHVVRAAVESEAPPTDEALACVSEQLEVAMVPAFDGEDVTLSRIFFVN
jgi:hypothetical protein